MTNFIHYIIIGAGIAGLKAAEGIRSYDVSGSIMIINGEDDFPYKRTKLSKAFTYNFDVSLFLLRSVEWFQTLGVQLVNDKVLSVSLEARTIKTVRHGRLGFGKLIFATGAHPRTLKLKGDARDDVKYFRNTADVSSLLQLCKDSSKVLIVGGGVLGVELAASMVALHKTVTLIHADTSLVHNHFDDQISAQIYGLLHANGVQIILQEKLKTLSKTGGGKYLAEIGDMIHLLCDLVVVAAGIEPETELANNAGILCEEGVLINNYLTTSHPDVFAAGDVAQTSFRKPSGLWHEAEYQGWVAGRNAAGDSIQLTEKAFRLKLEIFNHYFFSINFNGEKTFKDELITDRNGKYQRYFFNENRLAAALMTNDAARGKLIEQAVNEGWTYQQVKETFPE